MKHRSKSKPLATYTYKRYSRYVESINDEAQTLIDHGWPGALTLIFRKSNLISDKVTNGLPTIAIRMPKSKIALEILNHFGPMATTSVNISGEKELNSIDEIAEKFNEYIDFIVVDKEKLNYKPSMIIDCTNNMKIIRY